MSTTHWRKARIMGIDAYLKWEGQTEAELKAQVITGFSTTAGHVGYLREAYHGSPYATHVLFPECWEDSKGDHPGEVEIPASTLLKRLPKAIKACIERAKKVYGQNIGPDDPECKAFTDFVRLAIEMEKKTGQPCRVYVSY
jgi:hypothetical protein